MCRPQRGHCLVFTRRFTSTAKRRARPSALGTLYRTTFGSPRHHRDGRTSCTAFRKHGSSTATALTTSPPNARPILFWNARGGDKFKVSVQIGSPATGKTAPHTIRHTFTKTLAWPKPTPAGLRNEKKIPAHQHRHPRPPFRGFLQQRSSASRQKRTKKRKT